MYNVFPKMQSQRLPQNVMVQQSQRIPQNVIVPQRILQQQQILRPQKPKQKESSILLYISILGIMFLIGFYIYNQYNKVSDDEALDAIKKGFLALDEDMLQGF